jgi:hypothetical protein
MSDWGSRIGRWLSSDVLRTLPWWQSQLVSPKRSDLPTRMFVNYFISIRFNIITFLSTPIPSKWSHLFRFIDKHSLLMLHLPYACYMLHPYTIILLDMWNFMFSQWWLNSTVSCAGMLCSSGNSPMFSAFVRCFAYHSTMKTETISSSETSVYLLTARCYNPENLTFHTSI